MVRTLAALVTIAAFAASVSFASAQAVSINAPTTPFLTILDQLLRTASRDVAELVAWAEGSVATVTSRVASVGPANHGLSYTAGAAAAEQPNGQPTPSTPQSESTSTSIVATATPTSASPSPVIEQTIVNEPTDYSGLSNRLNSLVSIVGDLATILPTAWTQKESETAANLPESVAADGNPAAVGAGAAIDNLANTTISAPAITGGSVSSASVGATSLSATGDTTLGGNLLVVGNSTLSGNLSVGGNFNAGSISFSAASTTGIIAQDATITAATTTSLFSPLADFTSAIASTLNASVGNIVGFTATNATTTNLIATNATSTNFFATTASSTNVYATNASFASLSGAAFSPLSGNYLAKWNSGQWARSLIYDTGTDIGIGTTSPIFPLDVAGVARGTLFDEGGAVYNVKSFGAAGNGIANDTSAIQAAINAANNAGGGEVYFPAGTYVAQTLTIFSKIDLQGSGLEDTVLKLATSTNADLIDSSGFFSLTGTNSTGGIYNFEIKDITLDGNKSANTSGDVLRLYGYGYVLDNVAIRNAAQDGLYTEWSSNSGSVGQDSMEAHVDGLKVHDNGGNGIVWAGPHDSNWNNVEVFLNGEMGVWIKPNGAITATNSHVWGATQSYAWYIEAGGTILTGDVGEGATTTEVMIGAPNIVITGGQYYSAGVVNSEGCIMIGDPTHPSVSGYFISTDLVSCNEGGVNFYSDGGLGHVDVQSYQTSGAIILGTPAASTAISAVANGGGSSSKTYIPVGVLSVGVSSSTITTSSGLDVNGQGRFANNIYIPNSGTGIFFGAVNAFSYGLYRDASNNINLVSGTFGTPGITVASNNNVGLSTSTPWAKLAISANTGDSNANIFLISSSTPSATSTLFVVKNTGNVGIGTTSPSSLLSVAGGAYFGGSLNAGSIVATGTINGSSVGIASSSPGTLFDILDTQGFGASPVHGVIEVASSSAGAATSTNFYLDSLGDTYIGTSRPTFSSGTAGNLSVSGQSVLGNNIFVPNSGTGIFFGAVNAFSYGLYRDASNNINLVSGTFGTPGITVASNNNVGLSTSTPDGKLTILGVSNTVGSGNINLVDGGGREFALRLDATNYNFNIDGEFGGVWVNDFAIQRSSGNVGIGTSSPYARLSVWGPNTASTSAFLIANSASTTEFTVLDNGNATLAGTLTQNSDQRLKTDIQPLDASNSLAAINALNPVTFNWIDPNKGTTPQLGFIAQQVQTIFPNLVSTTSATALTPDGTLSLNYIDLVAPIVSAIQALSQEIASIETTIAGFAQSFTTALLKAQEVDTNKLCVQGTCVTGPQLQALLAATNQSAAGTGNPSSDNSTATDTPPVVQINGNNPAIVQVGTTYNDLGATITGPQADLNLGIKTFLNGQLVSTIAIDTSAAATDTIDYVATDQNGLTSTSTRTVIVVPSQISTSPAPADASTTASTSTASS